MVRWAAEGAGAVVVMGAYVVTGGARVRVLVREHGFLGWEYC